MRRIEASSALFLLTVLVACSCVYDDGPPAGLEPPTVAAVPHELELHGDIRIDNYYWLNQRDNPDVRSYLNAENDYTEAMTAHTSSLQKHLAAEFKERIKQDDESVPYRDGEYFYYSRTEDEKDYPIYARKKGSLDAAEEILIDVNELAAGHDGYFRVGGMQITEDDKLLAYGVDDVGRRIYTVYFKDLTTGTTSSETIENVTSNLAWANDHKTLFYTRQDPGTLRFYQIWKHKLGSSPSEDELVYEEADDTFGCGVGKTQSKRYIMISCSQTLANEYRYVDADRPDDKFKVFLERERGHEYDIDHFGDHFYIRTNDAAKNFRLMRTPVDRTAMSNWTEVIPAREDVLLSGFQIFKDHLVVSERSEGLIQLRIRPWDGSEEHYLNFGEPAYLAFPRDNHEFDTATLRFHYESLTTPDSIFDYDMNTRERTLMKEDEVLGGFEKNNYEAKRIFATARDGERIPISLVHRKGIKLDGGNPLLLGGYGSYGYSRDASFSAFRISLLDRGMVYAIAHIRGGQEMGRRWYDDGKLLNKKNTFTDFIDCGQHLVDMKYTSPDRLVAQGGSAGGLLIGAVVNMAPELFRAAHAAVPFVDVVTTMLDDSIPLTTGEFDEWGDPKTKEYYDYIKTYSPYDNVSAQEYPALLVTTGFHDSQVQYFEPAKWVAKLRATKVGDSTLLLKTEMEAGHGGAAARDKRYIQTAFEYAFLLDQVGISK
jgi:oligopeptidase B